ncbi:hypothetical protein PV318_07025 [Streptomyces sp. ME02-6991-2B]|nr:hypothetical protein [Streptomyces sp. ME02-6991-2B]
MTAAGGTATRRRHAYRGANMRRRRRHALRLRGDIAVPEGGEVFALRPAALDAGRVRLRSASDVVASLAPLPARVAG